MAKRIIPQNPESIQDTDASIVDMLDELLAQDDLYVMAGGSGFHLCEKVADLEDCTYYDTIDSYETRAAAYRAGIDCLIELSVEAWEQGGVE